MMIVVKRALLLFVLAAGCNPASSTARTDLASSDLLASAYPAGPYGNTVGATMPPLDWIGYAVPSGDVLATTQPYAAYSMDDLRRSGRAYGVVHVSAFF
jgi:hypothetical protein